MDPVTIASIAGFAGDALGAIFGHSSAEAANRANLKNSREQRAWETGMSNSAVQRRADDIEKAGGNRALAFTNGQSASTPSVSTPTMEPTYRPEWTKGAVRDALMTRAQLDNMTANTNNTSAQARKTNIESDIMEEITGPSSAADYEGKVKRNALWDQELRKAIAEADISETNAAILKEKGPLLLKQLQARAGQDTLDYDSAKAIAYTLGVAGKDATSITKLILELFKTFVITGSTGK